MKLWHVHVFVALAACIAVAFYLLWPRGETSNGDAKIRQNPA
jgi:hypothetical protein